MNFLAQIFFTGFSVDSDRKLILSPVGMQDFKRLPDYLKEPDIPTRPATSLEVLGSGAYSVEIKGTHVANEAYVLKISEAARKVQKEVISNLPVEYTSLDEDSIINKLGECNLLELHPGIFNLCQAVLLEVYTLNYILETDKIYLADLTTEDVRRTRKNLRFLSWWFSYYRAYRHLILYLRDLDVALGYVENQVSLLLDSTDLSQSTHKLNY